ncbi:MAG: DUF2007 domain-containing protein [bacterium]
MSCLITVDTFNSVAEAQPLKTSLESEGISCFLCDEFIAQDLWPNLVGGVKLQVREEDAEKASFILDQEKSGTTDEKEETLCPKCNSSNVYYEKWNRRLAFATWLLMGIPVPVLRHKWKCEECGHQWKMM